MKFNDLVGKTVASATQMKLIQYDDEGYLRLQFTDGTECMIIGGYLSYTGESEDEYPTAIGIVENIDLNRFEVVENGA